MEILFKHVNSNNLNVKNAKHTSFKIIWNKWGENKRTKRLQEKIERGFKADRDVKTTIGRSGNILEACHIWLELVGGEAK